MSTRIVTFAIATVILVLIVVPVVHWPVALGVVKAVALCGIAALAICRKR